MLLELKKLLDLWFVTIQQRMVMLFEFHIYDFRGSYGIEFLYIFLYIFSVISKKRIRNLINKSNAV